LSRQYSGKHEFYPSRSGGTIGADRKAATAIVYQAIVAGVASTVAIQGDTGVLIAIQATALNTDQIIINAAIAYVFGLGGGSVFIDEGTYTLGASVDLQNWIYFYGAGLGVILTIPAATDDCIDTNAASGFKIGFMRIRTTGAGANDGIIVNGGQGGEIFSVFVDISGQDGISISATSADMNIHNNFIGGITRYGINNQEDNCQIQDNRISGTGDDGIWLQAAGTDNIVTGNRIDTWTNEAIDNDALSNEVAHNQLVV